MESSVHAVIVHLGRYRGSWFECHIRMRSARPVYGIHSARFNRCKLGDAYIAISPRFAMSTEVSGLIDEAVVEL